MLDFLKRLLGGSNSVGSSDDGNAFYVYVRCGACGEVLRVRVNRTNDLAQAYDEENPDDTVDGYTLSKEVVGSGTCFRRLHLEMTFDASRREQSRDVEGGTIVSEEDYRQYQTQQAAGGAAGHGPAAGPPQ
jgi:hypothetical protein